MGVVRVALVLLAALMGGCVAPAMTQTEHAVPAYPMEPVRPAYIDGDRRWEPPIVKLTPDPLVVLDPAPWHLAGPRSVLYNGGFEEGEGAEAAGWISEGEVWRANATARTGDHALRLAPGARAWQLLGGATAGASAIASLHARGEGVLSLAIMTLDADMRVLSWDRVNVTLSPDHWADVRAGSIFVGDDALHVKVLVESAEGALAVDDAELVLSPPRPARLHNGGFDEHRAGGWSLEGEASIDCRIARSGCSLRLGHAGTGGATQRFAPAGARASVEFSQLTDAWDLSSPWLYVNWTFYDEGGAILAHEEGGAQQHARGWTDERREARIPTGTAEIELTFATNRAERGATWIDDVRLAWS